MSAAISYPAGAVVVHVHGSYPDHAPVQPATSLPKDFPHAAHADVLGRGRPVDPYAFRRLFPDQWSRFLRANFRSVEETAVFFNVTGRTAQNWWEGSGRATGDKVALAALEFPDSFRDIIAPAA